MALTMLEGPPDPFHSHEQEIVFEQDVVDGPYGDFGDQQAVNEAIKDIERIINEAHITRQAPIFDHVLNIDAPIDEPIQLKFSKDPYRRLGSLGLK